MKTTFQFFMLLCVVTTFGHRMQAQHCQGVTAAHYPVIYNQPDGSSLYVQGKGTGYLHYMQTTDRYTLLADKEGYLEYAELGPDGRLRSTGIKAHDPADRSDEEKFFVMQLEPNTIDSREVRQEKRLLAMDEDVRRSMMAEFPSTGTRK